MARSEYQPGPATDHYHETVGVEGAGPAVLAHSVTLTNDQILTLGHPEGQGIEIVPGAGAGKAIDVLRVQLIARIGAADRVYTNLHADAYFWAAVFPPGGADNGVFFTSGILGVLLASGNYDGVTSLGNFTANSQGNVVIPNFLNPAQASETVEAMDNAPIRLLIDNQGQGVLTGGHPDNTLVARTLYSVVDLE